jgi:small subunit ribosomal protein S8
MDPIANMLSTIKNASMSRKASVVIPFSMEKEQIASVLKAGGFLSEVKVFKEKETVGKSIRLDIAYDNGLPRLTELKRVSKPGRRVYKGYADLRPVVGGLGYMVLSTSRGVMTSNDARKKKLGGEVICLVY